MGNLFRNAIEKKKQYYIHQLISSGHYQKSDQHLYQLTLSELEHFYKLLQASNKANR
ncbi:Fur-regulated basic protein FbpA [Fictibacillus sp. Mic-4]|uniref:Fur-regulated basic protein FbpA n=1 Tax=Fictibacillus TaxID=1329200 RepID=UPI0003FE7F89|nr:Fur-regulated basic protein FbpA [Fictibacillus gelatini]